MALSTSFAIALWAHRVFMGTIGIAIAKEKPPCTVRCDGSPRCSFAFECANTQRR